MSQWKGKRKLRRNLIRLNTKTQPSDGFIREDDEDVSSEKKENESIDFSTASRSEEEFEYRIESPTVLRPRHRFPKSFSKSLNNRSRDMRAALVSDATSDDDEFDEYVSSRGRFLFKDEFFSEQDVFDSSSSLEQTSNNVGAIPMEDDDISLSPFDGDAVASTVFHSLENDNSIVPSSNRTYPSSENPPSSDTVIRAVSAVPPIPDGMKSIAEIDARYRSIFPYNYFNRIQSECLEIFYRSDRNAVVSSPTASGKCWGYGTKMLMYNGTFKEVQDIVSNDKLMGDDGTERIVQAGSVISGCGEMFEIVPKKEGYERWTCNADHILVLQPKDRSNTIECTVRDFLNFDQSEKDNLFLFQHDGIVKFQQSPRESLRSRVAQIFGTEKASNSMVLLTAWVLGVWFANGNPENSSVFHVHGDVVAKLEDWFYDIHGLDREKWGEITSPIGVINLHHHRDYCVRLDDGSHGKFSQLVKGFYGEKMSEIETKAKTKRVIPFSLLTDAFDVRASLLAGLIDCNGSVVNGRWHEFPHRSPFLHHFVHLCRGLGFFVNPSYKKLDRESVIRVESNGNCCGPISLNPFIALTEKRVSAAAAATDKLTQFSIEPVGFNSYFGFALNGNGRCLLEDFVVTHNTVLFEMAVCRMIKTCSQDGLESGRRKCVYVAPTKALVQQMVHSWREKFSIVGLRVTELTSDVEYVSFAEINASDVILTTPEKWDSMTRTWKSNVDMIATIKLLLIDEVHLLNEETRGGTLEAVVSRMKTISNQLLDQPVSNLRICCVSATFPNVEDVAQWIDADPESTMSFGPEYRPVPLEIKVFGYEKRQNPFLFDRNLDYKLFDLIMRFAAGKPTLVFCSSRKGTVTAAKQIMNHGRERRGPVSPLISSEAQHRKLALVAASCMDRTTKELMEYGLAYHHSGLNPQDRRLVESAFLAGDLPVLCTTSTLALGVNFPAHLVILKGTSIYRPGLGYCNLPIISVLQMIGRAGRPQFDTNAIAIVMTEEDNRMHYMNLGNMVVESALHHNIVEHLNAEIVLGTIRNISVAVDWLKSTFLTIRIRKNPMFYNIPRTMGPEELESHLTSIIQKALDILQTHQMIEFADDLFSIKSAPIGEAMARFYVRVGTITNFSTIQPMDTMERILQVLAESQEFKDIRNHIDERKVLNELNKNSLVRFPITGKVKTDSLKIQLLIQTLCGQIPIEQWSLIKDQTAISTSAPRILRCMIEYLRIRKQFVPLYNAMLLMKCIEQRLWESSHLLTRQIDKIGAAFAKSLSNAGISTIRSLASADPRRIESIVNRNPPFGSEVKRDAQSIPLYSVVINQTGVSPLGEAELELLVDRVNEDGEDGDGISSRSNKKRSVAVLVGNAIGDLLFFARFRPSAQKSMVFKFTVSPPPAKKSLQEKGESYMGAEAQTDFFRNESGMKAYVMNEFYLGVDASYVFLPHFHESHHDSSFGPQKRSSARSQTAMKRKKIISPSSLSDSEFEMNEKSTCSFVPGIQSLIVDEFEGDEYDDMVYVESMRALETSLEEDNKKRIARSRKAAMRKRAAAAKKNKNKNSTTNTRTRLQQTQHSPSSVHVSQVRNLSEQINQMDAKLLSNADDDSQNLRRASASIRRVPTSVLLDFEEKKKKVLNVSVDDSNARSNRTPIIGRSGSILTETEWKNEFNGLSQISRWKRSSPTSTAVNRNAAVSSSKPVVSFQPSEMRPLNEHYHDRQFDQPHEGVVGVCGLSGTFPSTMKMQKLPSMRNPDSIASQNNDEEAKVPSFSRTEDGFRLDPVFGFQNASGQKSSTAGVKASDFRGASTRGESEKVSARVGGDNSMKIDEKNIELVAEYLRCHQRKQ